MQIGEVLTDFWLTLAFGALPSSTAHKNDRQEEREPQLHTGSTAKQTQQDTFSDF